MTAGLRLYSLLQDSHALSADSIGLTLPISTAADIAAAMPDVAPLTHLIEATEAFDMATSSDGAVLGVSVAFPSQLVLAVAICQAARARVPGATIVLGGPYFGALGPAPVDLLDRFDCIDAVVRGPGELVLEALARHDPRELALVRTRFEEDERVIDGTPVEAVPPDYSDVQWSRYTSSQRSAPFSFLRSCHYAQCRFCNGDRGSAIGVGKAALGVFDGLTAVAREHRIECIYVVDAALRLRDMESVALKLAGRTRWAANARPDRELANVQALAALRSGGCWMLRFGLESGSQQVLDAMRKGTRVEEVSMILRAAAVAGIKSHVYIMVGYPGETSEDRLMTVDFLREHRNLVYSYSVSLFQAVPGTPVYREFLGVLAPGTEDEGEAVDLINSHLYGDEDAFANIQETVGRIDSVLRGSSRTNRLWYSGRVFQDSTPELDSEGSDVPVFRLPVCPPLSELRSWFSSVVSIAPTLPDVTPRRSAFVDLVNDRAVVCEMSSDDGSVPLILREAERLCARGDIDAVAGRLGPSYAVNHLESKSPDGVLQHEPGG